MRRREFITLLGGGAATWRAAARAQQGRDPHINIGVLTDMSGLFATLAGEGSVVAAHMAVEDFGGEALGRKIRVLFADHKHNVDVASAIATQWFNEANVRRCRGHAEFDSCLGDAETRRRPRQNRCYRIRRHQ